MKKLLILILLLASTVNTVFAEKVLVKVTPAQIITTSKKNSLKEGDYVDFKTVETTKAFKKGEIITGVVTSLEENGFQVKEARAVIENFRCKNIALEGEIYLHGGLHKKLGEFVERTVSECSVLLRGSEIIVRPDEQEFLLYAEVN